MDPTVELLQALAYPSGSREYGTVIVGSATGSIASPKLWQQIRDHEAGIPVCATAVQRTSLALR